MTDGDKIDGGKKEDGDVVECGVMRLGDRFSIGSIAFLLTSGV